MNMWTVILYVPAKVTIVPDGKHEWNPKVTILNQQCSLVAHTMSDYWNACALLGLRLALTTFRF